VGSLRFFACLSQKGKCAVSSMQHRGQRSQESIEYRKAKFFCFKNSKFDPKRQERIFTGNAEDLHLFVEAVVVNAYMKDIPDCPRGLVLADNHCTGAFQ
jgi:hypothetical protein